MKKSLLLLLFAFPVLSAQANTRIPTPHCTEFVGYNLCARVRYEVRHPKMPHLWHRATPAVVCLRGTVSA